ncbi:hypothetical protein [Flavobacterium foetidum]|uniref:hypothetical protein n=1 Tax=Flavobacterium foetidum TaxID=2026681 RepID=UPI0010757EC2|nr:hypothetical protein [Flavobacterium foetidum]KAF2515754.1 hypothetical protein E0W73_09205 [Flavobacterium foetidum]
MIGRANIRNLILFVGVLRGEIFFLTQTRLLFKNTIFNNKKDLNPYIQTNKRFKMIYINKNTFPFCYIEEKKFEWGEPYEVATPIFDLSIDTKLSDLEYTIEVLGKNNFKNNLLKLHNILVNREENVRIENFNDLITNREILLNRIKCYLDSNANKISPWDLHYYVSFNENDYLESIEDETNRILLLERKEYH